MGYAVRVVEIDGTAVRVLQGANVDEIVEEINDPLSPQISWSYPKHDPAGAAGQGADVHELTREIQVLRDGVVRWWGVILDPVASSSNGAIQMQSPGVGWRLTRLLVEEPRVNHLDNPGFETGDLTGWTAQNGVDATVIASPRRLGAYAVRLEHNVTGEDTFLDQDLTFSGGDIGLAVFFGGHYQIESWSGPALESRGLYIEGVELGVLRQVEFVELDDVDGDELGIWRKARTGLWVPPGETWSVNPRAYCGNASIVWDALQIVTMESTGLFDGDLATLAELIVTDSQDPAGGKADLSIATDCPLTGVTIPVKFWQHAEQTPADKAIAELVERDDGIDWDIVVDGSVEPATKTFTTYHPSKGVDRTGGGLADEVVLLFGEGGNVATYDFVKLASAVENDVIENSPDGASADDPLREEGRATDTSGTGGLVFQGAHTAPPGTEIDELGPRAQYRLAQTKTPPKIVEVVTHEGGGGLIDVLGLGDMVNVVIDDGNVQVDDSYRIVRIALRPRSDTMALTLNLTERGKRFPHHGSAKIARLAERVEDIERRRPRPGRARSVEVLRFSQYGPVFVAESGEDIAELGGQVASVTLTAKDNADATGDTIAQLVVNGSNVGSPVTLSSSDTLIRAYIGNVRIAAHSDRVRVDIIDAGGHDTVTALVRLRS